MIITDFYFTLIKDLIRGIVEEIIHHEKITLELTQSILNEQITTLLTKSCQMVLVEDTTFNSLVDDLIKGKNDLTLSNANFLNLIDVVTDFTTELEQSHDLDKIKSAIQKGDKLNEARKLMSARLETSWVAGQSDFDDLSLQAQLTLFTRDLTSSTALAKMTTSMVTDLDLSQVCLESIKITF